MERLIRALPLALVDNRPRHATRIRLDRAVPAYVDATAPAREQSLRARQLEPRRDQLDRLKALELRVNRIDWLLGQFPTARLERRDRGVEIVEPPALDLGSSANCQLPRQRGYPPAARGARSSSSLSKTTSSSLRITLRGPSSTVPATSAS
ncbi:MAG: hypothetical protein JO372_02725, partial [Solirubrobacterales bacterium]|nr:hypothetical protein [Solirubrobacterales bacterium]